MRRPLVFVAITVVALAAATSARSDTGKALFDSKCAICHGSQGDGQGPAAYLLSPKPRDFTAGVYKLKSTPTGSLPTDEDIFRTITSGVPGTSMPSWVSLSESERHTLVAHVKSLSPRFVEEEPGEPITIGPEPVADDASRVRGKKLYEQMGCASCHGATGHGDGQAAATLTDDAGYPISPLDFTQGSKMRGGGTAWQIARTMKLGLEGTPMPSYGYLPDEQLWDLTHYVQSLGVEPAPYQASADAEVIVQTIAAGIPLDPTDVRWREAPLVAVPLRPLWTRGDAPDYALVRGLANGKEIAFFVEWSDPVADQSVLRPQDFRDAVALQFPLKPGAFYGMGARDEPVNIWQWKSDWQQDLVNFADVGGQYATLVSEFYPLDTSEQRAYSSGWAAGNLLSSRTRKTAVEDLNSAGQGTLTAQSASDQNVDGRGVWVDGVWRVVFKRPLSGSGDGDVRFSRDSIEGMRIALAVWDGAADDRNGQKSVSEWHRLRLEVGPKLPPAKGGGCQLSQEPGAGAAGLLLAVGILALLRTRRRLAACL